MASLQGIYVYPVKSLDALAPETATVGAAGSLSLDRQFAMVDDDGAYVNGKRTAAVHRISATFEPECSAVTVADGEREATFALPGERDALATWLDECFEPAVSLLGETDLGYPDDASDVGPTVVSTGTLETIAGWYDEIDGPTEMRRRLRPNLVVDADPFWEDRLYGPPGESVRFRVGDVAFEGAGPCQRCIVPTRDPDTGEPIAGFQTRFVERREATLPPWAPRERFDHYYKVMVNTRTPEASRGGSIAVGDPVEIEG